MLLNIKAYQISEHCQYTIHIRIIASVFFQETAVYDVLDSLRWIGRQLLIRAGKAAARLHDVLHAFLQSISTVINCDF